MSILREPDCGGCKGPGAHSRRCRTKPDWMWQRLADAAGDLGDFIGSSDVESANMAYAIAGRMKAKCREVAVDSLIYTAVAKEADQ